jgi:uncharacterized protein (DUF1778 family)
MPRAVVEDNKRMNLRMRPEQKALLARAAALKQTDLTSFVTRSALREAEAVIDEAERLKLSKRDSLRVLALLENPPPANRKLRTVIAAMPKPK